ncbi:MAG: thioredoxin family protein [Pirellulales bacterium]|nr:thioredoxin family protein [Pirellulales bacterium]
MPDNREGAPAQDRPVQEGKPIEMGCVQWGRDVDVALAKSHETGKPVFLQFQELPGCLACQQYGSGPLSHLLIVEAIEDCFIPVFVSNSTKGRDEATLKRFSEPAFNYPVARFLTAEAEDIVSRNDKIWSQPNKAARLAEQMTAALEAHNRDVPPYLALMAERPAQTETVVFAMHCYWVGEAKLGQLEGVLNTHSAWLQGKEVVEVEYDPTRLEYSALLWAAEKMECASTVFATSDEQSVIANNMAKNTVVRLSETEKLRAAQDSDQKYYLRHSIYCHLPLTVAQSTKINALLESKMAEDPAKQEAAILALLSPRQIELFQLVQKAKEASADAFAAWVFPDDDAKLRRHYEGLHAAAMSILAK